MLFLWDIQAKSSFEELEEVTNSEILLTFRVQQELYLM